MIKLNSFGDLEVPVGLFPSDVGLYLESTASRTVNYLSGLSLKEVNESLVFVRPIMRIMYQMGNDEGISKAMSSIVKRQLNRDDRFTPPEKEVANDALMMQMLSMCKIQIGRLLWHCTSLAQHKYHQKPQPRTKHT